MKNSRKMSRTKLKSVVGGAELNCHCAPAGSGKPALDTIASSAEACFNTCACYRGESSCQH